MALVACKECGEQVSTQATACPKCGAPPLKPNKAAATIVGLAVLAAIIYFVGTRGSKDADATHQSAEPTPMAAVETAAEPAPAPPPPPPGTLKEAVARGREFFSDEINKMSPGAFGLALWASEHLQWKHFADMPRTRRALVMKDSASERGKVLCVAGQVIEISVQDVDGKKFTEGGLMDDSGAVYRFLNVGSSGDLVEHSYASMCGAVIGRLDYTNSMGGTAHSILTVGMFDLPENKESTPLASASSSTEPSGIDQETLAKAQRQLEKAMQDPRKVRLMECIGVNPWKVKPDGWSPPTTEECDQLKQVLGAEAEARKVAPSPN